MPVGRKLFILDRTQYYKDYYYNNKAQYISRYEKNRAKMDMKDYYRAYYKQWSKEASEEGKQKL